MKIKGPWEIGAAVVAASAVLGAGQAWAEEAERPWTLSVSSGAGFFETAAPYGGVELSRRLGKSFVSGRISYSSSAETENPAARINLPSRTIGGGIGFGHTFGAFTAEAHGFYGMRRGDAVTTEAIAPRSGALVAITTEPTGNSLSFGGSLSASYGQRLVVTPFLAADWSSLRTNQIVTLAGRTLGTLVSQRESGVSGAVGLDVSVPLDRAERVWLGIDASANGATNGAATEFAGTRAISAGLSQGLNTAGQDGWGQFGAHASLALTQATTFALSGSRSVGVSGGDATSIGASLSLRF